MNGQTCGTCRYFDRTTVECWTYPNKGMCGHWSKHIKGVLRKRNDSPLQAKCYAMRQHTHDGQALLPGMED